MRTFPDTSKPTEKLWRHHPLPLPLGPVDGSIRIPLDYSTILPPINDSMLPPMPERTLNKQKS